MFKIIQILIVLTLVLLTGCSTTPQPVAVKTETKVITLPVHLKKKCDVTPPPDRTSYPSLSYREKEDVLTVYAINLLNDLKKCNVQIEEIKQYEIDQLKLLKDVNQ